MTLQKDMHAQQSIWLAEIATCSSVSCNHDGLIERPAQPAALPSQKVNDVPLLHDYYDLPKAPRLQGMVGFMTMGYLQMCCMAQSGGVYQGAWTEQASQS